MSTDGWVRVYYVSEVCVHLWRECIPISAQRAVRMADLPTGSLEDVFIICKRCRARRASEAARGRH